MAKKVSIEAAFLLQAGVALFLATLGIAGVRGRSDLTALIVAIVELVAGIVVAVALFIPTRGRLAYFLTLVIAILWLVYIIVDLIQNGFQPDVIRSLNQLAANVVILMALWVVNRRYA